MTAVLEAGIVWRWGYALVGGGQALLTVLFAVTRGWWTTPGAAGAAEAVLQAPATAGATLRLPASWLGIATFFLYTGVEMTTGQWAFSLLTEARGLPTGLAGVWVGAYWASLTVGRLLLGAVADRVAPGRLLRACILAILAGAMLLWLGGASAASLLGLVVAGLALAPVFPTLIAATPARLGAAHAANAVGFQVAAAAAGGAVIPWLIGGLAARSGLEVITPALVAGAGLLLVLHELLASHHSATTPPRRAL